MKIYIVDNKEFPSLKEAEMHVIGMLQELGMNDVRDYDRWKPFYAAQEEFRKLWQAEGHNTIWGADKYYFRYHNEKVSPEWAEYYKRLDAFEERMYDRKPKREEYQTDADFTFAMREWNRALSMDAPEKPGQHIANND